MSFPSWPEHTLSNFFVQHNHSCHQQASSTSNCLSSLYRAGVVQLHSETRSWGPAAAGKTRTSNARGVKLRCECWGPRSLSKQRRYGQEELELLPGASRRRVSARDPPWRPLITCAHAKQSLRPPFTGKCWSYCLLLKYCSLYLWPNMKLH